jgi:hypothetical protein
MLLKLLKLWVLPEEKLPLEPLEALAGSLQNLAVKFEVSVDNDNANGTRFKNEGETLEAIRLWRVFNGTVGRQSMRRPSWSVALGSSSATW